MNVSVILPIYNELDNITPLLNEIEAVFATSRTKFEVVAVDDGSTDGSRDLLKTLANERVYLKAAFFRANLGQAAAFDAGFKFADQDSDIIVTMDADRQNNPADIPEMIAILESGYDLVCGWRKNRQDGFFLRKIPSKIANWIIRKVTKTKIHDLGCSLKVFRKEITDDLNLYGEMHRFLAPLAEGVGARVTEFIVDHRARVAGESKYGLGRTFKVVLDLLTVWFMKRFHSKPLYFFGGTAVGLSSLGTLLFAVVAYQKWILEIWVHKNPYFLIAIILWLVAIQLVSTGLIAEIMVRTYFESQKKTPYIVSEFVGFSANGSSKASSPRPTPGT